jgi:hypothetical protein
MIELGIVKTMPVLIKQAGRWGIAYIQLEKLDLWR